MAEFPWAVLAIAVNLLALAAVVWKGGAWTGRVDAELKAEREATATAFAAIAESFRDVKRTLGNGDPGTVVRVPMCKSLHAAVEREISALREVVNTNGVATREDIRSLHEAVRKIRTRP